MEIALHRIALLDVRRLPAHTAGLLGSVASTAAMIARASRAARPLPAVLCRVENTIAMPLHNLLQTLVSPSPMRDSAPQS